MLHVTLWERYSKNSIWAIARGRMNFTFDEDSRLNYKTHNNKLFYESPVTNSYEVISYTYRF